MPYFIKSCHAVHVSRFCIIMLFLIVSGSGLAQTYLVDFSDWETPNGSSADTWNTLTTAQTSVTLLDKTGASSSVSLNHNLSADNNDTSSWTAGNVDWFHVSASDGLFSGASGTVTIGGLNDGMFYEIDVVALETMFPSTADITVQGIFADTNRLGTNALGNNWVTDSDGVNNWLTWTKLSPSSGTLTINITSVTPGTYSTLSAIRIQTLGPSNTAPTAASFAVSSTENQTHTFSTANFGFNDADGDQLNFVLVETLPAAGVLYVDANNNDALDAGEGLSNGSMVLKADLDAGNLQYIQNDAVDTSFQFEVNDGTVSSTGNYQANIVMTAVVATVTSVAVPANDTYINGENLVFTVNFSKAVEVSTFFGTPALELVIGGASVEAQYVTGSGSNALVFSYTVQNGQSDSDGIVINVLNLNNGEIFSNGNLDANLTLNNIGNSSAVLVDAIAPQLQSVTRQNPVSSPTDADVVTLRYTFTESVIGVQASNFGSTHPMVITEINVNPVSGLIYDVTFGGPALANTNDEITFSFGVAGVSDVPGNGMQSNAVIGTNNNSYIFANYYFVGGTVSGLLAGNYLVLTNNGGDDLTIMDNGAYVFDTPLVQDSAYMVVIDLEPNDPIQPCLVLNDDGSIDGADVVNVDINCEVGTDLIYRNGFE